MYQKPNPELWAGRVDNSGDLASMRYHQVIKLHNLTSAQVNEKVTNGCVLLGFASDEGVRRNNGRIGAADAPSAIRQAIASIPFHYPNQQTVIDAGDIRCIDGKLEESQQELGQAAAAILKSGLTPIILGGGHETLYGHYLGVREHIGKDASLGIINIDAHFDMRSYEVQSSSGTMFKQILDEDSAAGYLAVGIQSHGNTRALFETAVTYGCKFILEESIQSMSITATLTEINAFMAEYDYIMLTLCTDVLDAAHAPGVSAPSAFGISPQTVRTLIQQIMADAKTLSFDISEVNPKLDENNRTVKLAANLVNEAIVYTQQEIL